MYTKHKYSDLVLRLKEFKFEQENNNTKSYIKTLIGKDEKNYYMEYYIHYIWNKNDKKAEICVSSWTSRFKTRDRGYEWYTGDYEEEGKRLIKELGIKIKGLVLEDN